MKSCNLDNFERYFVKCRGLPHVLQFCTLIDVKNVLMANWKGTKKCLSITQLGVRIAMSSANDVISNAVCKWSHFPCGIGHNLVFLGRQTRWGRYDVSLLSRQIWLVFRCCFIFIYKYVRIACNQTDHYNRLQVILLNIYIPELVSTKTIILTCTNYYTM